MVASKWFDDVPVIGNLPPEQAAAKLREVGEDDAADMLEMSKETQTKTFVERGRKVRWPFQDRPWQYTAHTFGYLPLSAPGSDPLPIRSVSNIPSDPSLKHARIKITLNHLRVAAYPGRGIHRVLLHFYAQNQVPGKKEDVHFNSTYRVLEGQSAGSEGMSFRCRTINVSNDQDETFLDCLESDVFKAGLKLVNTAQPLIAPFSEMALGLAKAIAKHHRNVSVQDFDLGLDFGTMPMGARLAEGAYLAVQIPESFQTIWDWNEWVYQPNNGRVVNLVNPQQLIPYNYLVFGMSRYEEA